MQYWLMKSEPSTFGIEHLQRCPNQTEPWDGVRNYQSRNMMRDEMKKGDRAFFYHSNCKIPGIVGTMKIVRRGYPDPTAFDPASRYFDPKSNPENPRWYLVDVQLQRVFKECIPLSRLREMPALQDMTLLQKGNRLSITPVRQLEWKTIMALV